MRALLDSHTAPTEIKETALARTALDAALALDCEVDQIAKSIVLRGETTGEAVLFITAGGQQVDLERASALAGEPLGKADAALIRAQTGFAIGGVSPVAHLNPCRKWFDTTLLGFDKIWAAAGTPHHVFCMTPQQMIEISGAQPTEFIQNSK